MWATSSNAFGTGQVSITGTAGTLDLRSDSNLSFANAFTDNTSSIINVDRGVGSNGYGGYHTISSFTETASGKTLTVTNNAGNLGQLGAANVVNGYGLHISSLNLNVGRRHLRHSQQHRLPGRRS